MSREKGLHGCIPSLRVLLEGSSALWVHKEYMLGAWSQWGSFRGCLGTSSVTPVAEMLAPNKLERWAERWAGKFGGRRRRVGAAFVRMEITVSPVQSVALFPGDNCKTGLRVLKNS